MKREDRIHLMIGDRIRCKNWKELKKIAFQLSAEGYGVQIIGFRDMDETILTIAALPEQTYLRDPEDIL